MDAEDKEWATKYILDPLTAPEPSQETGPGASHYNKLRASIGPGSQTSQHHDLVAAQLRRLSLSNSAGPPSQDLPNSRQNSHSGRPASRSKKHTSDLDNLSPRPTSDSSQGILTPPSSASPTRSTFASNNPYAKIQNQSSPPSRSNRLSPPDSPSEGLDSKSSHRHRRPSSIRSDNANSSHSPLLSPPPYDSVRRRTSDTSNSRRYPPSSNRHYRQSSLGQRFPGDMSHRPLDVLKHEARVADRSTPTNPSGSRRHRRNISDTDTIDVLDTVGPGGAYHHGGPYDATLISRNLDNKYSPVAAVQESNLEAIKATPAEYIKDSLQKHMPLQGTSTIAAGSTDMSGNIMEYEEGVDLMREPDAPGGAYKRWDGVQYLPGDLKGKGEPSYTYEKDLKERKKLLGERQPGDYEMQPAGRQRSASNGANAKATAFDSVQRSHSTGGKKLSEGLKRRFGSIRRKKVSVGDE